MPDLQLPSLESVSTLRNAPENGAPSSKDYNDSWNEVLADLTSVFSFVNNTLLPMLNVLPAAVAAVGLDGAHLFASRDESNPLFFSAQANQYLSVADVLSNQNIQVNSVQVQIQSIQAQVAQLRTKLATTNQNDILNSIQSFSDQLRVIVNTVNSLVLTSNLQSSAINAFKSSRADTGVIPPLSKVTVNVNWLVPFADNNYTPVVSIEDESQSLGGATWVRLDNGVGVAVTIGNIDDTNAHDGTIHVLARADA